MKQKIGKNKILQKDFELPNILSTIPKQREIIFENASHPFLLSLSSLCLTLPLPSHF
ncbi:MAG: hypothetical protein JSW62_01345 [Thermoplasmatales archaeon]|nr:MAG: hypothetical protein JSW62_01345 [Thermoplasmatales archaeon]